MNYNNKCNNLGTCGECKNQVWLGKLIQLENWKEKGSLCRDCLVKIKIPCRRCSNFFNKIENFSEGEKSDYEQHERIDRKKWEKENPGEKCWPYIGCEYYIHGGQFCNRKDCKGHFVPQHGHFCSRECHEEWVGGASESGNKYKEWKAHAEKLGWTPCQEKDIYRGDPEKFRKWVQEKYGEEEFACKRMAAPGEKYCFYCEHERSGEKWGDHRNNAKNWVKSYRDYWKITDDKNDFSNNGSDNSGNNSLASTNDSSKTEKLQKELIKAKRQRKSQEEIKRLQSELEKLNNSQLKGEIKPVKDNSGLIMGAVIIFSTAILISGVILIGKKKKNK